MFEDKRQVKELKSGNRRKRSLLAGRDVLTSLVKTFSTLYIFLISFVFFDEFAPGNIFFLFLP